MGSLVSNCLKGREAEQNLLTKQTTGVERQSLSKMITFKDYKGFKSIDNIKDLYQLNKQLGRGSFGEVLKAINIKGQFDCAVKVIKKVAVNKHEILLNLMHNELEVLQETTHPHIMRIFELLEDTRNYYIVSELLQGGELYERVVKMKHFSESDAATIISQILLAVSYMHNRNIIHRDIKPENILLQSNDGHNLDIKMTDFGFACFFDPKQGLSEVLGSPLYMAPEIIKEEVYDLKVDIWSIGVIAYILLCGRPPFKGRTKANIFNSVINDDISFELPIFDKVSDDAKQFIQLCLEKNIQKRPSTPKLLDHKWIKQTINSKQIEEKVQLGIADNLKEYQTTTNFQSGILQFIISLKATNEDLDNLKQLFIKLDTSQDGTLQLEELRSGMGEMMHFLNDDVQAYEELLKGLDLDGNGVIDYTEFITAAIDKQAMVNKKNLKAAFDMIDIDNSGMITVDELQQAFDSHHTKDDELWKEIMSEVDVNHDNQISFDEFNLAMTTFLKKQHLKK